MNNRFRQINGMESPGQAFSGAQQRKLRRLNGRLQACDPCRRQKVACDHGQPVCQRCIRKSRESKCTYTISAHSVTPFQPTQSQSSTPPQRYSSPVSYTALSQISKTIDATSELHAAVNTPSSATGPSSRTSGYLGYASSATVIDEARESLPNGGHDSPVQAEARTPTTALKVSRDAIERGVAILRHLPSVGRNPILDDSHILIHGWIHRIAMAIHGGLSGPDAFGACLHGNQDDSDLRHMAHALCVNTAQPVDDALEGKDWVAQFTGRNTRWESIGLLLIFWEISRRSYPTTHPTRCEDNEIWRGYTNSCIELCDTFSEGNLVTINLYNRRASLESMTSGDASLRTANAHAQTIACLGFLGYHVEPLTQPYVPTLASELKRVAFATVYGADKSFSTFTGRPPLISGGNATTPLPLDIPIEHLFGPQNHLEFIAATTLDERGWSKSGTLSAATCLRARGMLKRVRDDILAIALGSSSDNESSMDALLRISKRQDATMAEFPACIMYRPEDIANPEIPSVRIYTQLMISSEALQNSFFLDRLLLKKGHDAYRHLLLVSYRMVSNTLALWTHFERFSALKRGFQWMLMSFGAPAGGILCKELQKPTLPGNRHPEDPEITRSSIIQKLSLLVGFLDWVDPSAPNAELCNDCKIVIKLVLDQTLNGSGGANVVSVPSMADQFGFEFPNGLDFNFDLLDSFDWLSSGQS